MIRPIILFILLGISAFCYSQNPSVCDSVSVNCCSFNSNLQNSISLEVSNSSSNIFSYPGFILFNEELDTIAIETVNYYGIGLYPQSHILEKVAPMNLPFYGSVELHSGFYSNYECTFPIIIEDSIQTGIPNQSLDDISVYPNPADDILYIDLKNAFMENTHLVFITDISGKIKFQKSTSSSKFSIRSSEIGNPGMYFVKIYDTNSNVIALEKLIIR